MEVISVQPHFSFWRMLKLSRAKLTWVGLLENERFSIELSMLFVIILILVLYDMFVMIFRSGESFSQKLISWLCKCELFFPRNFWS